MRITDKDNYNKIRENISMNNLGLIIKSKNFSITKVAMNSKISDSTIISYINGQKIPSVPTLISIADFLNCNIDFLLDRTSNPIQINDIEKMNNNKELNMLFQSISSLPKEKQQLIIAYVKGLQS